jgi:hypothetical protein
MLQLWALRETFRGRAGSDVIRKVRGLLDPQVCTTFPHTRRYSRIMSSQTLARPKRSGTSNRKRKTAAGWVAWWPLLAGIAITFAAVKMAEILPLMGADGLFRLKLLYPYALLLKQPQLGLSEPTSNNWSQIMLYSQWALYGLYASVAMRWKSLGVALMQVAAIHLLGFGVLWILAHA